ncbi:MAG: hypothetical protein A3C35_00740 [Omnitrophica bacterium RIFCSPHIGHO2_02_FULL_46_11]|nr:MAG: hypothetical protein A3C35_00740 [Omnitrophica bacterium RIFCSPHIGHO2_02_FULL_46_11]OGW87690.1 MAG: hypothetical protein A3A81_04110 [Omnitrophica bacterium RIFCSPLOWO2_01_FULL_45_10b]
MKSDILFISLQDEDDFKDEIRQKQNEFLDLYSLYLATSLPWIKEELLNKAYQLHLLDPNFTFHV